MIAALMAMQQHGGMGGPMGGMNPMAAGAPASPQLPHPPAIGQSAPQPSAIPAVPGPQTNPMIAHLLQNPSLLQQLLGKQQPQGAGTTGTGGLGLGGLFSTLFGGATPASTAPNFSGGGASF